MWVGAFESKPIESVYLVTSDLLNHLSHSHGNNDNNSNKLSLNNL